jgi:hypothetical protein
MIAQCYYDASVNLTAVLPRPAVGFSKWEPIDLVGGLTPPTLATGLEAEEPSLVGAKIVGGPSLPYH